MKQNGIQEWQGAPTRLNRLNPDIKLGNKPEMLTRRTNRVTNGIGVCPSLFYTRQNVHETGVF